MDPFIHTQTVTWIKYYLHYHAYKELILYPSNRIGVAITNVNALPHPAPLILFGGVSKLFSEHGKIHCAFDIAHCDVCF